MRNVLAIVLSLCVLNAFGQISDNTIERKGFVFGMGISAGVFSISDSDQEVAFDKAQGSISLPNFKLGWMVNDRLAILGSFPGMIYELEGKDRSFSAFVPSVQYWVKDRWWVNGGIGLAYDGPALYEGLKGEDWNFGCAVTASTGFELIQKKRYALDIQTQLHLASTSLDNGGHREGVAFTVGIGFNWYQPAAIHFYSLNDFAFGWHQTTIKAGPAEAIISQISYIASSAKLFNGPFRISPPLDMPERCPNCQLYYEPEPGCYFGAMFISYGLSSILQLVPALILVLGYDLEG